MFWENENIVDIKIRLQIELKMFLLLQIISNRHSKQLMNQNYDSQISMDEEYIPNKKQHSSKQRRRKSRPLTENQCNSNKWSPIENQKFLDFIKANIELLNCQYRRKEEKVFLQLSKQVKTRTADQCRSHHQKMIKHHTDLKGIIAHLEKKLASYDEKREQNEENSVFEQIPAIKQSQKLIKNSFDTALEIEVYEVKEQPKKEDDIWGLLNCDVWISNSLLFTNINY